MMPEYHTEITQDALASRLSVNALVAICTANVRQDRPRGQIRHDEYHFDNSAFEASYAYIRAQREIIHQVFKPLSGNGSHPLDVEKAWGAFGRLLHTAQDFYAHTNYVALWLTQFPPDDPPPPKSIPAQDLITLENPLLKSGKMYIGELLSWLLPARLRKTVQARLPEDSHARMNLDHPGRGPLFEYAVEAAKKRTLIEYEEIASDLLPEALSKFTGKGGERWA